MATVTARNFDSPHTLAVGVRHAAAAIIEAVDVTDAALDLGAR